MYLSSALVLESGALKDIEILPAFTSEGLPKPTVLVGRNGSGKSNLLSYITDALVEIAAKKFTDVAEPNVGGRLGHQWYRIVGGVTTRVGSPFEIALLQFIDREFKHTYVSKTGKLSKASISERVSRFDPVTWPEEGSHKSVDSMTSDYESVFRNGCYVFFPESRREEAYWSAKGKSVDASVFGDRFQNILGKPLTVHSAVQTLRPWIVDILLDGMIDPAQLINFAQPTGHSPAILSSIANAIANNLAVQNLNRLLQLILGIPDARLVRLNRNAGSRKIVIYDGQTIAIPGLDALSAGQAALFGIFGTILRYCDATEGPKNMSEMEGIVLVDELDAHLHAGLQYDGLPQLMKLFPRIQFIVTAHSPLFPLGMEKYYGSDGFSLFELPSGTQISSERFSEFIDSMGYLERTRRFEEDVLNRVSSGLKSLVLCEGETDPKYLRAAAELLGFDYLISHVDFEWIGVQANGQARDGGAGQLTKARKLLLNNPLLVRSHVVILFDCDQNEANTDIGKLHVRVIGKNLGNARCKKGIENLLREDVFDDAFFSTREITDSLTTTTVRSLDKMRLCEHLCVKKRDPRDFEGFRPTLTMLQDMLLAESAA